MAMLSMRWSLRIPNNAIRNTFLSAITAQRPLSTGCNVVNTSIVVIVVTLLVLLFVKSLLLLLLLYSFTCIHCSFNTNIYLVLLYICTYTCFCGTCNSKEREKSAPLLTVLLLLFVWHKINSWRKCVAIKCLI